MYIRRAYQSPCLGTHCALQWAQIPNFASRNQSGVLYCFSDSQDPEKGPGAILLATGSGALDCPKLAGFDRSNAGSDMPAESCFNKERRWIVMRGFLAPSILSGFGLAPPGTLQSNQGPWQIRPPQP